MPTVKKMRAEEVEAFDSRPLSRRALIAAQYDGHLANAELQPGDYGEATLDEEENKITVRNRLQAAADRRGWMLHFMRTKGQFVRFYVEGGKNGTESFLPAKDDEIHQPEAELVGAA
jgi:hypothetical protein